MKTEQWLLVGIDGGGSSLRMAVANGEGEILAESTAGCADYFEIGPEQFLKNLGSAWDGLCRTSRLPKHRHICVCAGLGCVITPADADEAECLLRRFPAFSKAQVSCVNDTMIAAEGAHAGKSGIHLVAGTGSVCVGKPAAGGAFIRVGGFGPLFDDVGSGYAIGRAALSLVSMASDGRHVPVSWADRLFRQLHISEPQALYRRIHADSNPRYLIASLAPIVFDEAENGDPVAVRILDNASSALSGLVLACADRMNQPAPVLTMSGSLMDRQAAFRACICSKISKDRPGITFSEAIFSPVEGAVQMARQNSMLNSQQQPNTTTQ